jgi:hypothetical protein
MLVLLNSQAASALSVAACSARLLSGEQLGCWDRGRYLLSTPGGVLDARGWAWTFRSESSPRTTRSDSPRYCLAGARRGVVLEFGVGQARG